MISIFYVLICVYRVLIKFYFFSWYASRYFCCHNNNTTKHLETTNQPTNYHLYNKMNTSGYWDQSSNNNTSSQHEVRSQRELSQEEIRESLLLSSSITDLSFHHHHHHNHPHNHNHLIQLMKKVAIIVGVKTMLEIIYLV